MANDDPSYNPSHPDADWSGFVPSPSSKKHIDAPPVQITSLFTGPIDEWKPSRRVIPVNVSGSSPKDGSKESSTFTLFGGPVPANDPSVVGSSHWQTETQAATLRTKTTVEQLTESGRSMHICGKKSTVPAYENVRPFDSSVAARMRRENPYSLNDGDCNNDKEPFSEAHASGEGTTNGNLIGYRAHRGGTARSFLAGLGKEVALVLPPSKHVIAPAPYATDGDLPTDPYATSDGGRRKDMLLENYSGKRDHGY